MMQNYSVVMVARALESTYSFQCFSPMTTPPINASQLRLYYLQQLGIAVYVPRDASAVDDVAEEVVSQQVVPQTVPQTVPQQEYAVMAEAVPPHDVAPQAAAPQIAATIAAEPRPAAARRLIIEDEQVEARVVPATPVRTATTKTATADADDDTTPPFQLLFTVLDAELAIALQIPALAANGLREPEQKLLQNLLRWLGYPLPDLKSLLQYRWPLPGLPANSTAMAARTLSVFLQQAASTRPFRHLLLLGPMPAQCLQDQPAAWQLWPTHSLAELLALPQLKRDSWLQLQPLQHELQQKLH